MGSQDFTDVPNIWAEHELVLFPIDNIVSIQMLQCATLQQLHVKQPGFFDKLCIYLHMNNMGLQTATRIKCATLINCSEQKLEICTQEKSM